LAPNRQELIPSLIFSITLPLVLIYIIKRGEEAEEPGVFQEVQVLGRSA
jgi:hypothetical protein